MGGRRSLHELELASGARIVVAVDFDILGASDDPSTGADASTGGAEERAPAEPKADAADRTEEASAAAASPFERSARESPRILHAVKPIKIRNPGQEERRTSARLVAELVGDDFVFRTDPNFGFWRGHDFDFGAPTNSGNRRMSIGFTM